MNENNGVFEVNERVRFFDCDFKGRMRLSSILKYSAEIAGRDYTVKGFTHEFLWKKEMVFLLSRISLKIVRYPQEQEELIVRTWECGKQGALFLRGTEFVDKDGKVVISMVNGWILANPNTRKIYKPNHYEFNMPCIEEKQSIANPIGKIKYNDTKLVGKKLVNISDIDGNGHLYNAFYSDVIMDVLAKSECEKDIDNFRINYVSEAVLNDTIELYSTVLDNTTIIVGKVNEKVCFESEIIYK